MTRQTAALIKDILQDGEFINAIKDAVKEAVETKVSELLTRLEQQEGKVHDRECKLDASKKRHC